MARHQAPELPDTPLAKDLDKLAGGVSIEPNALWPYEHLLSSWQVRRQAGPNASSSAYAETASALLHEAAAAFYGKDDRHIARAVLCIGDYDGMLVKHRQQKLFAEDKGYTNWMYKTHRTVILVHVHSFLTVGAPQAVPDVAFAQTAVTLMWRGVDSLTCGAPISVRPVRAGTSCSPSVRLVRPVPPTADRASVEPPRFQRQTIADSPEECRTSA